MKENGSIPSRAAGPQRTGSGRSTAIAIAIAIAAATLALGAGAASGSKTSGGGGVTAPASPKVKDTTCLQRCLDVRKVTETGKAQVTGRNLGAVTKVKLRSGKGTIKVKPTKAKSRRVEFRVPRKARSGKPVVLDNFGNRGRSPVRLAVRPEDAIDEAEEFEVKRADAVRGKSFFKSKRKSKINYLFEAKERTDVRIDVLKGKNRRVVDSIVKRNQEPFQNNSAVWDGLRDNGKVASNGRYRFKVSQLGGGKGEGAGFRYYNHHFPLPARHTYGDGLGAGRGHQGFDIFANCGKPIVAARGGRVQVRAYHGSAGYYLVIDGAKTGADYVYMHLKKGRRAKKGSRVRTGEVIGYNGETGNASGCHLHFEIWSAPGWYEGGKPMDAKKIARRWDRWS